jgi:isopenicillin N synthase-like dioxygenase
MTWVPVIDLSATNSIDMIEQACTEVGFFTIVNHGVSKSVVSDAWNTARQFFALAPEAQHQVSMPFPGYPYGFSPLEAETLADSLGNGGPPDRKMSYAIGPVDPATHTFTDPDEASAWSPNLWPVALPELQTAWEAYFRSCADLSARLLQMMAEALHLPATYFDPMIDRHTSAMRALHYPAAAPGIDPSTRLGAGAHTDYGTLTILLADPNVRGLEVQDAHGVWHAVDPVPDSFVVNLGDAMARWTNDRWRSTMHRVIVPSQPRQSIAFFHNANWDALIECIPSCLDGGEVPRYTPIEAGPHLMSKFRATVGAQPAS